MSSMQITKKEIQKRIKDSYELPNDVLKAAPKPMVSVRTSTYQHAKYIKQCLEGVLAQKTDFSFEFIIGEDFSTDGTREIVFDYAKKYPDIIRVITADYNVGMKANGERCINAIRGKYIAICEGDDYWTDPYKLQKQIDFMEKNPDYTICFHVVKVIYENSAKNFLFPNVKNKTWYTRKELLKTNYIPTNSVVYRKLEHKNLPDDIAPGDWYMHLYQAKFGKIKFIDEVMSVYRKHEGGIWWQYDTDRDQIWRKYGVAHLRLQDELLDLYDDNQAYGAIIKENINRLLNTFIEVDKKYQENLLIASIREFPQHAQDFIIDQKNIVADKDKEIRRLWHEMQKQDKILEQKEDEIQRIRNTRLWKARTNVGKIVKGKKASS